MKRFFILASLAILSSCGNLPQPFKETPKVTTDDPLLDVPTAVGIAVLPVSGVPEPLATQISTAAAMRLQSFEIPAEAVPNNQGLGFTLQGDANIVEATAAQTSVVVTWNLRARRGGSVRTYRQVFEVPTNQWQAGDNAAAGRLGSAAGGAIAEMINGIAPPAEGPPPAAAPPRPQFPSVSIKPVEGAPGDGRESLRLAVLQSLVDNGVRRDDVTPEVTITCQMISAAYDANLQKVEIVWRALDRDGKELGTVRLDNTIPNGALDGPWGPTAFAIAGAALNDLLTLLASYPQKP
jgi:hypothetical protein